MASAHRMRISKEYQCIRGRIWLQSLYSIGALCRLASALTVIPFLTTLPAQAAPPRLQKQSNELSNAYRLNMEMYYIKPEEQGTWSAFGKEIDISQVTPESPLILPGQGSRGDIVTPTVKISLNQDQTKTNSSEGTFGSGAVQTKKDGNRHSGVVKYQSTGMVDALGFEQQGQYRVPLFIVDFGNGEERQVIPNSPHGWFVRTMEGGIGEEPARDRTITKIKQPIPYFERETDGAFVMRQAEAGMDIRYAILGIVDENRMTMRWTTTIREVVARTSIEGVRLNIGVPQIETRQDERTFDMPLQSWSLVIYRATDGGHIMALLYAKKEWKAS